MVRTGLYVVALAVAIIGLIWLVFRDAASVPVSYQQEAAPLDRTPANSVAAGPPPNQKNPAGLIHLSTELAPADVMGNSDYLMKPGASKARDLAIIVVSRQNGSRFAVVDRSGVVFGDSLPFPATVKPSFARREDGGPPNHYQVESGVSPHVSAHCGSGDDPFGKLEVRDDQLIYVPRK